MSHNDIEQLIDNVLRTEAVLELAELSYLDADTSHDKRRAAANHEQAVYAQLAADDMLDAALDEVWAVTFNVRVCDACQSVQPSGCGYCRDYDEATS